jgi:hypothetical protein
MDGGLMSTMIKLPGVGPVKSTYVYAGLGVTGGILAVAYWRRSKAPAVDTSTAVADPAATDPYAQYSDAAGYNTVYPPSGGWSPSGYDMYGNPLPPPIGSGSGGPYTTNRDWTTAAIETLADGGVTASVASAAISAVLGGLAVTSADRSMFLRAVGVLGEPPQGYPKPIHLVDTPAQPGTPGTPSGSALKAPGGLKVTHTDRTMVTLDWAPVAGAVGYAVYRANDPSGGGTPTGVRQSTTVYSGYTSQGLRSNTRYRFDIHPVGRDNKIGARARIYVTTKK